MTAQERVKTISKIVDILESSGALEDTYEKCYILIAVSLAVKLDGDPIGVNLPSGTKSEKDKQ